MVNKYNLVGFGTGLVLSPVIDFVAGGGIWALSKKKNPKDFAKGMAVAGAVELGAAIVLLKMAGVFGIANPLIFEVVK